jgi:cytochrome c oxidase subunit 2
VLAALVYWTSSDDYDEAASGEGLSNQTTTTGEPVETAPPGDIDGAALADSAGCTACHSNDGSDGVGPTWAGLAGTERPLEDGSSVLADSAYLLESIVDPNAKIAAGYAAELMPQNYGESLSDAELSALVVYLESLGS